MANNFKDTDTGWKPDGFIGVPSPSVEKSTRLEEGPAHPSVVADLIRGRLISSLPS